MYQVGSSILLRSTENKSLAERKLSVPASGRQCGLDTGQNAVDQWSVTVRMMGRTLVGPRVPTAVGPDRKDSPEKRDTLGSGPWGKARRTCPNYIVIPSKQV